MFVAKGVGGDPAYGRSSALGRERERAGMETLGVGAGSSGDFAQTSAVRCFSKTEIGAGAVHGRKWQSLVLVNKGRIRARRRILELFLLFPFPCFTIYSLQWSSNTMYPNNKASLYTWPIIISTSNSFDRLRAISTSTLRAL